MYKKPKWPARSFDVLVDSINDYYVYYMYVVSITLKEEDKCHGYA